MLPPELIFDILSVSLTLHPRPVHVLRTSSRFYSMSLRLLYNRLQFKSCSQIERFLTAYGRQPLHIPYPPHVIELDVDNDTKFNLFMQLRDLFRSCSLASGAEVDQQGRLVLDLLRLRLHSLSQDPNPGAVYDTLCVIKYGYSVVFCSYITYFYIAVHGSSSGRVATLPTTFLSQYVMLSSPGKCRVSLQIVPCVLPQLFRALATYTHLIRLELTHLSFGFIEQSLKLPFTPSLREIYLGQATFVSPSMIAAYLLSPGRVSLSAGNRMTHTSMCRCRNTGASPTRRHLYREHLGSPPPSF